MPLPKRMNFWKSSKRGGGSFPIQKFLLQILDFWTGFFWHKNDTKGVFSGYVSKNLQHNFPKMRRGGGQSRLGTFQKYTTCMVFKAVQLFKKSATWFSENEGGGQRPFGTFPKIHPFWWGGASLTLRAKYMTLEIENVTLLREASPHQNGWIFGKVPNGLWPPPPSSFSENYVADFHSAHPTDGPGL